MTRETAKASWYRIHLSTCELLMFVVGGLLWANMTPSYGALMPSGRPEVQLQDEDWGWPMAMYGCTMLVSSSGVTRPPVHWYGDPTFCFISGNNCSLDAPVFNGLVGLAIVVFAAVGSEWWIRRRERNV